MTAAEGRRSRSRRIAAALAVARATFAIAVAALVASACGGASPVLERHLVFVRVTPPEVSVWIADADGRHAHRLSRGSSAALAPDGRTVAVGRRDGIHLVSSDGKRDRRLTSTRMVPQAWSPDGRWLVAATDRALIAVDTRSGRWHRLAQGAIVGVDLAPSGRRVAYARAVRASPEDLCGAPTDLYVVRLSGADRRRLTRDGRSASPVWGPKRIAFRRLPRRKTLPVNCPPSGIWTIRPDGSELRPLIARPPDAMSRNGYYGLEPVAWLPGDGLLVGVRSERGDEAARLDRSGRLLGFRLTTGKGRHRVVRPFYVDEASRDGRFAVGSGGGERALLAIIRVSDGRPLFTLGGAVCCPDWNR